MAVTSPSPASLGVANPLTEMDEEIDYVLGRLSGTPANQELTEAINTSQDDLNRKIENSVRKTLLRQEKIEKMIDDLTEESEEIDLVSPLRSRITNLKGILKKIEKNHAILIEQIQTNAAFLQKIKGHTAGLKANTRELKAEVTKLNSAKDGSRSYILEKGETLILKIAGVKV